VSRAYHAAVSSLKSSRLQNASALAAGLGNNVEFGTDVQYRNRALRLSPKNDLPVQECMIFKVAAGSKKVKDAQYGNVSTAPGGNCAWL
jgi:hypothetical protein